MAAIVVGTASMVGGVSSALGGVLITPFLTYAAAASVLLLRPALRLLHFDRVVSNLPFVLVSLHALVLAVLLVVS